MMVVISSSVAVLVYVFLWNLNGDRRPDWVGTTRVVGEGIWNSTLRVRNTFSMSPFCIFNNVSSEPEARCMKRVHTRCDPDRITCNRRLPISDME